jgi:hypothetical protein
MDKELKLGLSILELTIRIQVSAAASDQGVLLSVAQTSWVITTPVSPRLDILAWSLSPFTLGRNTPVPDNDPQELVGTL